MSRMLRCLGNYLSLLFAVVVFVSSAFASGPYQIGSGATTSGGGEPRQVNSQTFNFPLNLEINELTQSNGDIDQTTTASQNYTATVNTTTNGRTSYTSSMVNAAQHQDTLELDSSFNILGNTGQSAGQQYTYSDSTGFSYQCDLSAAANVLTAFSPTCAQ